MRRRTLFTSGMAGILLLAGGCSGTEEPPPTGSKFRSPSPVPSSDDSAKRELVAALQRTQTVPFQFTVKSDLTDGASMQAGGAVDVAARRHRVTVRSTAGVQPTALERINVGGSSYVRNIGDKKWAHLDMSRVGTKNIVYVDMTDPIGLVTFTSSVVLAERTGPRGWSGWVNLNEVTDPLLPVGAPMLYGFGLGGIPFQVTTDESGWVTSLTVTLTDPKDKSKLVMTTTFSGHGKPVSIKAPSRSTVEKADDYWYH